MRKGDWPLSTLDITSGAVHAMSESWAHRMDLRDGVATLNLLFDCDNDALTIKSGLPFDGRIEFTAKQPVKQFRIAVPGWLEVDSVHALLNGKTLETHAQAGYINLSPLNSGDTGNVSFDLPCKREKETVDGVEYTTTWVGSQIIEILPRGEVSPLPF